MLAEANACFQAWGHRPHSFSGVAPGGPGLPAGADVVGHRWFEAALIPKHVLFEVLDKVGGRAEFISWSDTSAPEWAPS